MFLFNPYVPPSTLVNYHHSVVFIDYNYEVAMFYRPGISLSQNFVLSNSIFCTALLHDVSFAVSFKIDYLRKLQKTFTEILRSSLMSYFVAN